MQTSERDFARTAMLALLVSANILFYLSWPWLRSLPLVSDSAEPYTIRNAMRNELYLKWLFDAIHSDKQILFVGTSESNFRYNLAAQLNQLAPDNPKMHLLAKGGLSPIHSALLIAKWKREHVKIPPLVFVINPIYFTRGYDVIVDGWLEAVVRSPVFLRMNHRQIQDYLSQDVIDAYDRHYALKKALLPATIQEYLGNLFYLYFHQVSDGSAPGPFWVPEYAFSGELPDYDESKNVWRGSGAPDRFEKTRWLVNEPENSLTLKGLASIMTALRDSPAPIVFLMYPVNRKFYEYHGLDMSEFEGKYGAIRASIRELAQTHNANFIDLFDLPRLHLGFQDRMHVDQYGTHQLARFMARAPEYVRFTEAVRQYYKAQGVAEVGAAARP